MSIADLERFETAVKDSRRRRDPDTRTEERAGKRGIGIVAGPVAIAFGVLFIGRKIPGSCLGIVAIEGRYGKERRDLHRHFQARRVRMDAPAIRVIAIITAKDD